MTTSPLLPGTDLPDGWTVRPPEPTGDDGGPDVDLAFDVVRRCELAVLDWCEATRGEVVEALINPDRDEAATLLVLGPDGRAAGYLVTETDPIGRDTFIDAYVDPGYPGLPPGLWSALLEVGVARTHVLAAADGHAWVAKAGSYEEDAVYGGALTRAGFEPVRHFWRMAIDLDPSSVPVVAPPEPAGATIEVARTEEQRREMHAVFESSFADHWGHTAHPADDWLERMVRLDGLDPERWWLVRVDGVPAALAILDDSRLEFGEGYVRILGVGRDFRGRGLARWLLLRAFADYRDAGRRRVTLTVDSDSPTGARALYESVGMSPRLTIVARHRMVLPG